MCPRASARPRKGGQRDRMMIDRVWRLMDAARRGEARWFSYLFASGLALGTDAGLFLLLLGGGLAPVVASALGYAMGILVHWLVSSRSEEHTSELQSLMRISYAVFCWKKKTQK